MSEMGRYCKAYPVPRFREFSEWKENLQNLRREKPQGGMMPKEGSPGGGPRMKPQGGMMPKELSAGGAPPDEPQRTLTEDDHLYLQENFVVTDGIFMDENIIFDAVTPEWMDFCKNTLKFEVPSYETVQASSSVS